MSSTFLTTCFPHSFAQQQRAEQRRDATAQTGFHSGDITVNRRNKQSAPDLEENIV